ncbi:hypothetical protein GQ54DRAFT_55847 [Martensiomyces pterosporus]|nr:hypothetical protein GQ54DRAFT_55847 [Martensiomyces pterosporus]
MSYDRSPNNPHNLNSLLSPRDSRAGASGEGLPEQDSPYARSSYQSGDGVFQQSAHYQSPQMQQQQQQQQQPHRGRSSNEYSRYSNDYDYSRQIDSSREYTAAPESHQYAYAETAATQQHYRHSSHSAPSARAEYADYRDGYGRHQYDYSMQHQQQEHQGYGYDYDRQHSVSESRGVYDHPAYARHSHHQHHHQNIGRQDDYYSRQQYSYGDHHHGYAQDPAQTPAAYSHRPENSSSSAAGHPSMSGAESQQHASMYYDSQQQQQQQEYHHQSSVPPTDSRSEIIRSPAQPQHSRQKYSSHSSSSYNYDARSGQPTTTRSSAPGYGAAPDAANEYHQSHQQQSQYRHDYSEDSRPSAYRAQGQHSSGYNQDGQIPDRGYNLDAHLERQSGTQQYGYSTSEAAAYSYAHIQSPNAAAQDSSSSRDDSRSRYQRTPIPASYPVESDYRSPSQRSHTKVFQRDPAYGTNPGYHIEMSAYANEHQAPIERHDGSRRSAGFGIASLLSERPASPVREHTPVGYDQHYGDRAGSTQHDRAGGYADPADKYHRHEHVPSGYDAHAEAHGVMSISQLVGGGSNAQSEPAPDIRGHGPEAAYRYSRSPQAAAYGHRTPPRRHEAISSGGTGDGHTMTTPPAVGKFDDGLSPDIPLAKRQASWLNRNAARQQDPIVVTDDESAMRGAGSTTPYAAANDAEIADRAGAVASAGAGAGAGAGADSDDDSRPLVSRTTTTQPEQEPERPARKRRRQTRQSSSHRDTGAAEDTAAATNGSKSTSKRRRPRRSRGSKKVELSREFVYDEDEEDDDDVEIALEQSAASLDANGYPRDAPGDQEVAAPNAGSLLSKAASNNLPADDISVDQHVQEYIHHVKQRTERAIARYEERAKRKSQRMHEHVVKRYGPYLQGYFDHVGEGKVQDAEQQQQQQQHLPGDLPREDEYDIVDESRGLPSKGHMSRGRQGHRSSHRAAHERYNGYGDNLESGSPFGASHSRLQPPLMGYFTPSRPVSPSGYGYGYERDGTPVSDASEPAVQMTEEEIAEFQREEAEQREQSDRSALWSRMAVEQVPRAFRHMQANIIVRNANMRKVTHLCQREVRRVYGPAPTRTNQLNPQQPIFVQRPPKELLTRARRSMREMLLFWKRHEKEEREMRKRAEKEAAERQRQEEEAREARRQARKLNFLITQTELYSHFIGNKIGEGASAPDEGHDENAEDGGGQMAFSAIDFDDEDDASLAAHARQSAQNALAQQQAQTRQFDETQKQQREEQLGKQKGRGAAAGGADSQDANVADALDTMDFQEPETMAGAEVSQPRMLMCQLKEYQLKGLNWLANLYEQGINGILADEMGLGKTVQSISLLAYLAETHNIWGPFMVVAPASTLHNWQQELTRFVPEFKILPYWGTQKDRKVLRKSLWNPKNLSRKDSAFHVLVTSYQLVVSDESYLNRVKWQYMVLDEAQAIKSSSSARWKTLLGFHCRNRLLLTGTPIQNSMQELWALLHFIMPTLFDSHEEFSEWFSRDIEAHAENRSILNQHQLHRLHMILKPFMLRRNKRHVQHELGEKIEHLVPCDLTQRQKVMYRGLMSKISVPELLERLQNGSGHGSKDDSDESLMNLVMQFRKVCSHPELFERAEVESPFVSGMFPTTGSLAREGDELLCSYATRSLVSYHVPKLIYRESLELPSVATARQSVLEKLTLWSPANISSDASPTGLFSLLRLCVPSANQAIRAFNGSIAQRLCDVGEQTALDSGFKQCLLMCQEDEPARTSPALRNVRRGSVLDALTNVFAPENLSVSRNLAGLARVTLNGFIHSRMSFIPPGYKPPAVSPPVELVVSDRSATWEYNELLLANPLAKMVTCGKETAEDWTRPFRSQGLTDIWMPSMDKLIRYSGKMAVLDRLLARLKQEGHRVLLYFQMTKMIDLFEEYLAYRKYTYLRLDGSSKISDRRDMVMDWQTRDDIFIFLLSTRAGGLGINLTAADTVIFFESDWNPTVDSQAMDRAHRLGQTKQVVVYRLITRGTVEERILQRARQKDEIHRIVISGGDSKSAASASSAAAAAAKDGKDPGSFTEGFSSNFEPNSKEIVSLLLGETADDENKARSERLVMARHAQDTSNRLYPDGRIPDVPDLSSLGDDSVNQVVVLPPPSVSILPSSASMREAHSQQSKLDAVFESAIREQIREQQQQQQQQKQRQRGGGRGSKRGGGNGSVASGQTREKRKARASTGTPKKDSSKAGSRAGTPEPSAKRVRGSRASHMNSAVATPQEAEAAAATPANPSTT